MPSQDSVALERFDAGDGALPLEAAAVLEQIRSGEIKAVVVGGADTSGIFRAKRISARRFARTDAPVVQFSEHMFAVDISDRLQPRPDGYEGHWPAHATGLSDLDAVADLATLRRVPWLSRTALVLCDYRHPNGDPYEFAPRSVLRRVLERYRRIGLEPHLAPELEFLVFRESDGSARRKGFRDLEPLFAKAMAFGATQATVDDHILGKVVDGLTAMRVPIESWAPEGTAGQYELNVEHAPALEAADRGFLFKHGVKEICSLEGMTATFMSKLDAARPGSSMHVHQSLWRDGEPAFFDPGANDGLSPLLRHFVAGQLSTLIPFAPIWMPNPAAFKRSVSYMGVGTSESWGADNRTLSLRVLAPDAVGCRVEHRVPGADTNVYLALAAMLAGGLYGIEHELEPPPPTVGDAFKQTELRTQPKTLDTALGAFEESPVANEYLGEEFVRRYAATRRWEAEQACVQVTDWELERYFSRS